MATDADMDIDMNIDMEIDPEVARMQAEAEAINARAQQQAAEASKVLPTHCQHTSLHHISTKNHTHRVSPSPSSNR